MRTHGLLLAAGAGRRMGRPKALLHDPDGTSWLRRSVATLAGGGCDGVTVVLGAAADEVARLVPDGVEAVVAEDWASGMGASLRTGLRALGSGHLGAVDAVLVMLVDLPDVGEDVVARLLAAGHGPDSLARATYAGRPGHPVLLGSAHWAGVRDAAVGDRGARDYLASAELEPVECGDLATGADVDAR